MARLTILLALLAVALFAAVQASAWQQQQEEESGCEGQLQRVNLRLCEDYLTMKIREQYKGKEEKEEEEDEDEDEEGEVLRMRVRGGMRRNHHRNSDRQIGIMEDIKECCCEQLSKLEGKPQCLCEGMQQIMYNTKEEMKSVVVILEGQLWYLPISCGLRSPFGCDLKGPN